MTNILEKNKILVTRFIKALTGGDLETTKSLMSEDIVHITPGTGGRSGVRNYSDLCESTNFIRSVTRTGIDCTILNLTAEDDRVSCEMEGRSTLVNGVAYNNQYHILLFLRDGKVYKMKEYYDTKLVDDVVTPLVQSGLLSSK